LTGQRRDTRRTLDGVRRVLLTVTAAVVLPVVAGCGGSGGTGTSGTSRSPSVTPSATLPAHTGLVGAIDSARRVAVCENVRLYATTVDGGLQDAADQTFQALVQTMRQRPREAGLEQLVRRWMRWRAHLGDARTAQKLTAFCAKSSED
jgi:hypothetical protein